MNPPILSDKRLDEIYKNMPFGSEAKERERVICRTQRDADMTWFREEIEKLKALGEVEMKKVVLVNIALFDDEREAPGLLFKVAQAQLDDIKRQLKEVIE